MRSLFLVLSAFMASFTFHPVYAEQSYQFAVGGYLSYAKIGEDFSSGDAKEKGLGLSVSAYFKPVILDGRYPHEVAAYYQRRAGAFLTLNYAEASDLNAINGGLVLTDVDYNYETLGVRLSDESLPYYLDVGYFQSATDQYFRGGSESRFKTKDVYQFSPGWFINETLSVYAVYVDHEAETYGVGVKGLHQLASGSYLEANLFIQETDYDALEAEIVNNVVRNLDVSPNYERVGSLSLNYFDGLDRRYGFIYRLFDDERGYETSHYGLSYQHYLSPKLGLGAHYLIVDRNRLASRMGGLESQSLTGTINYRF